MKRKMLWFFATMTWIYPCAQAQTHIDQDARIPATTDQQSMLLLLQVPEIEGITVCIRAR